MGDQDQEGDGGDCREVWPVYGRSLGGNLLRPPDLRRLGSCPAHVLRQGRSGGGEIGCGCQFAMRMRSLRGVAGGRQALCRWFGVLLRKAKQGRQGQGRKVDDPCRPNDVARKMAASDDSGRAHERAGRQSEEHERCRGPPPPGIAQERRGHQIEACRGVPAGKRAILPVVARPPDGKELARAAEVGGHDRAGTAKERLEHPIDEKPWAEGQHEDEKQPRPAPFTHALAPKACQPNE
jgi:hypothetical protein